MQLRKRCGALDRGGLLREGDLRGGLHCREPRPCVGVLRPGEQGRGRRPRVRMAKLNARIDAVLNRTGNTQPIVLSFKDRAIVTGTLAQQNNFTILALKPRADLMAPVFKESETLVANDTADVAKDQGMLGETP